MIYIKNKSEIYVREEQHFAFHIEGLGQNT